MNNFFKYLLAIGAGIIVVAPLVWYYYFAERSDRRSLPSLPITKEQNMRLTSTAFSHNTSIPSRYTCDGENINPPLSIADVPDGTKSFVLIMDDPDAPSTGGGGTFVHWTIWNINPAVTEIAEDSSPEGAIEGITSFGRPGYGGPCPPSGTHHYFFKVYALDTTLTLDPFARAKDIESAMEGHILAQAELVGIYARER